MLEIQQSHTCYEFINCFLTGLKACSTAGSPQSVLKVCAGEVLAPEMIAAVGLGQGSCFLKWAMLTAEIHNWLK